MATATVDNSYQESYGRMPCGFGGLVYQAMSTATLFELLLMAAFATYMMLSAKAYAEYSTKQVQLAVQSADKERDAAHTTALGGLIGASMSVVALAASFKSSAKNSDELKNNTKSYENFTKDLNAKTTKSDFKVDGKDTTPKSSDELKVERDALPVGTPARAAKEKEVSDAVERENKDLEAKNKIKEIASSREATDAFIKDDSNPDLKERVIGQLKGAGQTDNLKTVRGHLSDLDKENRENIAHNDNNQTQWVNQTQIMSRAGSDMATNSANITAAETKRESEELTAYGKSVEQGLSLIGQAVSRAQQQADSAQSDGMQIAAALANIHV